MDRYFYSVEEYNGYKEIHFSGNVYYNDADETDKCFRIAEWTGLYITVDKLKELRLDVPQVTELAYELKKEGIKLPDGILTIEELVAELGRN